MKCRRCGVSVSSEEQDRVVGNFNRDYNDYTVCFACAEELFNESEQDQSMLNPCQDEGDNP